MKHIDTFNSFLNEAKGVTYDFTEEYAKKNGIKYTSIVNRWNNLDQIVFFGSAKDFFKQKSKLKFAQITEPTGFDENTTTTVSIEIGVKTGEISKSGNEISTMIHYAVNFTEDQIKKYFQK